MYKLIADSDTPVSLLSLLADKLRPLSDGNLSKNVVKGIAEGTVDHIEGGIYTNYFHFFKANTFYSK